MSAPWFEDVCVVDVSAGRISDPQAVAIEGGRIVAFAPTAPRDAETIEGDGKFLAPGLIDTHVHFFLAGNATPLETYLRSSDEEKLATAESNASTALASGITTMRDCGAPAPLMAELRARLRRSPEIGPDVISCGAPLTRPRGHLHFFGEAVSTTENARAAVLRQLRGGNEFIKLIASGGGLTPHTDPADADLALPLMQEATGVAHSQGASVAAHCHATESILRALTAGVDVIEHASFVTREGRRFEPQIACRLRSAGAVVNPTVIGALRSAAEFRRVGQASNPADVSAIARLEGRLTNTARFRELGLKIVAGTDAGVTGTGFDSLVDELLAYQSVGFSAAEALRCATSDAAEYLGLGQRGQVLTGWRADLVLLEENPLADLRALRCPAFVMKGGRVVARGERVAPRLAVQSQG
jgi:imidazolonepropionase-like amidohydrolase